MSGFEGRTAIVTGGGSGIGRSVALALARVGCDIGVFDLGGTLDELSRLWARGSTGMIGHTGA